MSDFFIPTADPIEPTGNPFAARVTNAFLAPGALTQRAISPFQTTAPRVDPNFQRNLTTLTNKYNDLSPLISQLPPQLRNALINYDSTRVARGSNPLTREQTVAALDTALNNRPATPPPDRSPLNFFGNLRSDLSDILKSIPRIPSAMLQEVRDIPDAARIVAENRRQGMNPIAAIANAPGVRMLPGAFIAGNVAQGNFGELATHPLMTFLDALPAASRAAAGTQVGRAAIEAAEAVGRRPRPLAAVMTGRVVRDADGNLVRAVMPTPNGEQALPVIGRNRLGQGLDTLRTETSIGQTLDAYGGKTSRAIARVRGGLEQRAQALLEGYAQPATEREALAQRAATLLSNYADEYPFLRTTRDAAGGANDQLRADFLRRIERGDVEGINPQLVSDYRTLQDDIARYNANQDTLGRFDGEWFDTATAARLQRGQSRVDHSLRMREYANRYLNPAEQITPADLRSFADDVMREPSRTQRAELALAFEHTLDAYGVDVSMIKSARAAMAQGKGTVDGWNEAVARTLGALDDAPLTPRRDMDAIIATLRTHSRRDPQVARLIDAVARGDRHRTTAILKNLYDRKPPTFPDELYPAFRDDVRSMSRRVQFDMKVGAKYTDARVAQRQRAFQRVREQNAPARFHGLLSDQVRDEATVRITGMSEAALGRTLTADEAGQLARALGARNWTRIPGVSSEDVQATLKTVEREVTATWQQLRDSGLDPVFVHRVSPGRANQAYAVNIGPVPGKLSQTKQRVLDLSPQVLDLQVSLRHQAAELLQQTYNETFVDDVVGKVAKTQAQLRDELMDETYARMAANPSLDFEATFQSIVRKRYERFNPDEAGLSWGGARLDKYRQEDYFIPKAHASNLHQYAKPPSIVSSITDPLTKAFRYSVIGLSPSIIVNNFFSNSVAAMAESGPGVFAYWGKARDWLADPSKIPDEQLKAMMTAEIPHMEYLNRDAWLRSRTGAKMMTGYNAGKAFHDSAVAEAARTGKRALDVVVEKSMRLQRLGDNVYRAMQYMHEFDRQTRRGATSEMAAARALQTVRDTFVDYTSFTPIERSAMRTIIPFYSYMGHAARFIMRYPFDHPARAAIAAHIADAERDRLGALPGSFLSMVPLPGFLGGGMDEQGEQTFLSLRAFDPFGDMADLTTVSGWLAATNPLIQTALQQAGVYRGEAELYPTLRYDPQTGRMRAVRGNVLVDLFHNTVPRAGLLTAALGVNPTFNDVRERDPDAARRMLLSMGGIPRFWREMSPYAEMFKSEVSRQTSQNQVRNEALKTGNWNEAMRDPQLRAMFEQLMALPPEQLAANQAQSPEQVAAALRELAGS